MLKCFLFKDPYMFACMVRQGSQQRVNNVSAVESESSAFNRHPITTICSN